MGVITFNGVSSKDVGIEVETFPTYDVPEKEYEVIHVPGRNGDVVIDTGTYRNTVRTYSVSIATYDLPYYKKMNAVAEWLHSSSGYGKLSDSYEPDFYRYGYYQEQISIENLFNEAGKATLNFICKPQRFYKTGDMPVIFTATGKIQNKTINASLPIINVYTDNTQGEVYIGDYIFTVKANSGTSITVDSELQDAYSGSVNKNSSIVLNSGAFPILEPGINNISFSGGITRLAIYPKWWTI